MKQAVGSHLSQHSYVGLTDPIFLSQDTSDGCGGKIWPAADVMIDYIIAKNERLTGHLFEHQTVMELGSGTGLVGLAVAKICPHLDNIIITDQIPMMSLMQENIHKNDLDNRVKADILNWGEEIPKDSKFRKADVILLSDCVYLEIAFLPLIDTLYNMANKDTIIWFAYCKRRKADKRFFTMAKKKFEITEIQDHPNKTVYSRQGLYFYVFKKK
ncbi:putative methyltransferase-domain-containing protein [Pilobolus umbonatus]|nr:putative methyltransferase-domain-containing protein [Pilobolus umbonatus]